MTKDEIEHKLFPIYDDIARDMSFYNAAEGDSWSREANNRGKCQERLRLITALYRSYEIDLPKGNYLL